MTHDSLVHTLYVYTAVVFQQYDAAAAAVYPTNIITVV